MTARLADIQTAFQDRLLTGSDKIVGLLADGGFLGVYDHAYTARLLEVLAEDFPALHTLLGDESFEHAMRAYLADNPSRRPSIRWLGERLADWLSDTPPWNAQPMIADMAGFEWLLGLTFDAADGPVFSADGLAAISPEAWPTLAFDFHPALNVRVFSSDVTAFQQAVARDETPDAAPSPLDAPATWAAWRDPESMMVRYDRLDDAEAIALAAARDGADFTAICECLAEHGDSADAAVRAATLLKAWLDRGWISGLAGNAISWAE